MAYRKRMSRRSSKRAFKNGARRSHYKNRMRNETMRGGIRL